MTVQVSSLGNGLRVATDRMEGLASAAVGVWVDVGSRQEVPEKNGLAHFLEHMAFKGTGSRTALEIAEQIESAGGFMNAYTSNESTAYHVRLLSEELPAALEILADILRDSRFAAEDVEMERGVILQEIGRSKDSPEDCVRSNLVAQIYPDHPLGRDILGTEETVSSMVPDDFRAYVAEHYRPGRMLISAAGDVRHDDLVMQAEALFGDMPAASGGGGVVPASFTAGESREAKDLEQVQFAFAMPAPDRLDPDRFAAAAFATVVGGNMSSRLFQEARERRGLCYAIGAWCALFMDTGLMVVLAGTGPDKVQELGNVVVDELSRATGDVAEEEVARVRKQMRASVLMGLESPWSRCERLASELLTFGRPIPTEETLANIDAIDVSAARAAGRRMLDAGAFTMAVYGDIRSAPTAAALSERLGASCASA